VSNCPICVNVSVADRLLSICRQTATHIRKDQQTQKLSLFAIV